MTETTTHRSYKDLRGYLAVADKLGELRRVDGADWDLEFGAITEVAARATIQKSSCSTILKVTRRAFAW